MLRNAGATKVDSHNIDVRTKGPEGRPAVSYHAAGYAAQCSCGFPTALPHTRDSDGGEQLHGTHLKSRPNGETIMARWNPTTWTGATGFRAAEMWANAIPTRPRQARVLDLAPSLRRTLCPSNACCACTPTSVPHFPHGHLSLPSRGWVSHYR